MEAYAQEIHDLHHFFQGYLLGEIAPELMERFESVTDSGFTIVTADGAVIDREGITNYIRDGHGSRPEFTIWTENVVLKQRVGDILIVTYEEWQTIKGVTTSRTSTVVFKEDASLPNGLCWLHVHESGLKEVVK